MDLSPYEAWVSMFARHTISRIATSLLGLVAIGSMGFAAPRQCGDLKPRDPKSICGIDRPCCCGTTATSGACCCHRDEETPTPLPAPPDDQGRMQMWVPWIGTPSALVVLVPREQADVVPFSSFISTFARSVQSLLCVWRV